MTLPASEETVPATDEKFELHMASDESPLGLTLNKLRIIAFRNGTPENRQAYYDALSVAFQNGMLVSSDTAVIRATATREQAVRECAENGWQPIQTAPKDGGFLAGNSREVWAAWHYDSDNWHARYGSRGATHWQPLPTPPLIDRSAKT